MAKFAVGVSIGVVATVGCYAFAASSATALAATFTADPGAHNTRMGDFDVHLRAQDKRPRQMGNPL